MVRKGAPQPLALDTSSSADSPSVPLRQKRDNAEPPLAGETSLPGPSSGTSHTPVDLRSSRSPRSSPFSSKFAPKKLQSTRSALQPAGAVSQQFNTNTAPERDDPDSAYLPIDAALQQPPHQDKSQSAPGPVSPSDSAPLRHVQVQAEGNKKSTKSGFFGRGNKVTKAQGPAHVPHQSESQHNRMMSRDADDTGISKHEDSNAVYADDPVDRATPSHPSRSNLSLSTVDDSEAASVPSSARRTKPKPFGLLTRSRSIRDKEREGSKDAPAPLPISATNPELGSKALPLRTAPATAHDRSFRDMMNSNVRNRSADRAPTRDTVLHKDNPRERDYRQQPESAHRDNGGSTFLSGLRNSSTRAADMISKGLFGKSSRSGSTIEREAAIDDDQYVFKTINLPLVQQTRKTRIAKRLEDSRDKTEFWMPAFPWRAIDYLNYKGCEVEGLYRVPGSGPQIKRWQRRFDEEYDVNLFEQETLYDINIIGSMLKAWLRELPDELFPKAAQERIARECAGSEEVPQMLIDELSNLPPYQYYLLFAITCHLSLLLAHSDKNKMDFRNLCICFQPCMKIDAFSFKFLVCDWRDCWKGCKTEAKYIEEEYKLLDELPPSFGTPKPEQQVEPTKETSTEKNAEGEDRQPSSSEDSKPASSGHINGEHKGKVSRKPIPFSTSKTSIRSNSSISTTLTVNSEHEHERERGTSEENNNNNNMRPLSPIKPLSPIGF